MFKSLREKLHRDLILIGIAVIIAGFVASGIIGKFEETAIETAASIVEITEPDGVGIDDLKGTVVTVEYFVDGEKYSDELGYHEDDMMVGQTVMVRYDPENPSNMRPAEGPDTVKNIYITGACIALAGIVFSIIMKRNERKRADRRAEKRIEKKNSR